ncbi:MAG: IclR family transcriptional regulator [Myxococcales bacterium]|nr:MAG: IclR family transcriptional regulator [Myxococcales bacterium]
MLVLHAFTPEDHGVGFAELQRRTGLPKATLHRMAGDLVEAGLLDRTDGQFHLGSHLFELGMLASVERTLIEVAMPFLEDLYERTHEVVHLARREGPEVVYVAKVTGHRGARAPSRVGGRMPVHATALGKALLAHASEAERVAVLSGPLERRTPHTVTAPGRLRQQLDGVLAQGVAFENEEGQLGLVCVAAPVLDGGDHPVAAISISGNPSRFRPSAHAASVRAAAAGIAATLARRAELAASQP